MKTATLPSLRVEPTLRQAAESVLLEGETLTALIETAVRETIQRRQAQAEFIARGLAAAADAQQTSRPADQQTSIYHAATEVHAQLQDRLDARRRQEADYH